MQASNAKVFVSALGSSQHVRFTLRYASKAQFYTVMYIVDASHSVRDDWPRCLCGAAGGMMLFGQTIEK
jgi:hypothetical protein